MFPYTLPKCLSFLLILFFIDIGGLNMPKTREWFDGKIRCTACNEIKETIEFSKTTSYSDGYHNVCKMCQAIQYRERTHSEAPITLRSLGPYTKNRALMRRFYAYRNQCKRRNKGVGILFDLTLEQFASLTENIGCSYCGGKSPDKNYVGIDRIDSTKGYIFDNCVPCCIICNRMKSVHTKEFFLAHIAKIFKKSGT